MSHFGGSHNHTRFGNLSCPLVSGRPDMVYVNPTESGWTIVRGENFTMPFELISGVWTVKSDYLNGSGNFRLDARDQYSALPKYIEQSMVFYDEVAKQHGWISFDSGNPLIRESGFNWFYPWHSGDAFYPDYNNPSGLVGRSWADSNFWKRFHDIETFVNERTFVLDNKGYWESGSDYEPHRKNFYTQPKFFTSKNEVVGIPTYNVSPPDNTEPSAVLVYGKLDRDYYHDIYTNTASGESFVFNMFGGSKNVTIEYEESKSDDPQYTFNNSFLDIKFEPIPYTDFCVVDGNLTEFPYGEIYFGCIDGGSLNSKYNELYDIGVGESGLQLFDWTSNTPNRLFYRNTLLFNTNTPPPPRVPVGTTESYIYFTPPFTLGSNSRLNASKRLTFGHESYTSAGSSGTAITKITMELGESFSFGIYPISLSSVGVESGDSYSYRSVSGISSGVFHIKSILSESLNGINRGGNGLPIHFGPTYPSGISPCGLGTTMFVVRNHLHKQTVQEEAVKFVWGYINSSGNYFLNLNRLRPRTEDDTNILIGEIVDKIKSSGVNEIFTFEPSKFTYDREAFSYLDIDGSVSWDLIGSGTEVYISEGGNTDPFIPFGFFNDEKTNDEKFIDMLHDIPESGNNILFVAMYMENFDTPFELEFPSYEKLHVSDTLRSGITSDGNGNISNYVTEYYWYEIEPNFGDVIFKGKFTDVSIADPTNSHVINERKTEALLENGFEIEYVQFIEDNFTSRGNFFSVFFRKEIGDCVIPMYSDNRLTGHSINQFQNTSTFSTDIYGQIIDLDLPVGVYITDTNYRKLDNNINYYNI